MVHARVGAGKDQERVRRILAGFVAAALISAAPPSPLDRIIAGESASAVLTRWCTAHRLAPLRAERLPARGAPSTEVRRALEVDRGDVVSFRKVKLVCGGRTLSVADNWYLPSRLSPDMNHRLDTSEAPFGLVVRPLGFERRTLKSAPDKQGRLVIRALLTDRAGAPFSFVVERYAPLPP